MEKKLFYRVGDTKSEQGLWYDPKGNFTGLIHTKFNFCMNHDLPMPFDEDIVGWVSTTDDFSNLFHWFSKEDILRLEEYGYRIALYEATEYRIYTNHWVIKQDTSVLKCYLNIDGSICETI